MTADGTKTALDLVTAAVAEDEPCQLDMLGLPLLDEVREAAFAERRGRGRPKGARNRRTEATAAMLIARHGDPVEEMLVMAMMPVAELAARLNMPLAEAWAEKRACLTAVSPYLKQRQPLAVNMTNHQYVQLVVEASPDVARLMGAGGQGEGALLDLGADEVTDLGAGEDQ